MARSCTVCSSAHAAEIDALIATGRPLAQVHAQFSDSVLSYAAIRRHAAAHHFLSDLAVRDAASMDPTTLPDLADRLLSTLDDMDRLRVHALRTNRPDTAVKAAAQSRQIIAALAAFGITDTDAVENLRQAQTLAQAVGRASRADAAVRRVILDKLRGLDPAMADELEAAPVAAAHARQEIER